MTDRGHFLHYMIKKSSSSPSRCAPQFGGRVSLEEGSVHIEEEIGLAGKELCQLRRISIVASGTSRHAGMGGRYMIQELASLP